MATKAKIAEVTIQPPNFQTVELLIRGIAPYVQNKFSAKGREEMRRKQEAGSTAVGKKKRPPKDFDACFRGAQHISSDGWNGMPAPAFRNALISACRVCGFVMARAKLAVFIEPDGFEKDDGTPLVKITKGRPKMHVGPVRLESGVIDLRSRPMWREGWEAKLRITFDADMFTASDIANLLARAGRQVGVGEGRPDSKKSAGMGWGLFQVVADKKAKVAA